jgi:hypothetical protein
MSQRAKALERARRAPKGWTSRELAALFKTFGFVAVGGSKHDQFTSPCDATIFMTVTRSSGEIPAAYVRQAVQLIDAHRAIVSPTE